MAGYIPVVEPESCAIPTDYMMVEIEKDIGMVSSALRSMLEYNKGSAVKRLKRLDKVIKQEELSEDVKKMLGDAAEVMQAFNSKSVHSNVTLYAEKKMMLSKSAAEKAFLRLEMNPLLIKEETVNNRIAKLQRSIQLAKQQNKELQEQHEKKMAEKEILMVKTEEQKKTLQDLMGDIQSLAITDLVASEELQSKMDLIRQMRNECAGLRAEIDQYMGLPPNTAKAEALLMQTKQEYDHLCHTLNTLVYRQKKSKTGRKP